MVMKMLKFKNEKKTLMTSHLSTLLPMADIKNKIWENLGESQFIQIGEGELCIVYRGLGDNVMIS